MNKALVIGCPGSGKSTFARALHTATDLPLYHLDLLYWNADKTTVSQEVFRARLEQVLQQDRWIIDGHYAATLSLRLARCDSVFWLDLPLEDCLAGIEQRRGQPRPDMPWVETMVDSDFADYVRAFHRTQRNDILPLLRSFPHIRLHILRSHQACADFLASLTK